MTPPPPTWLEHQNDNRRALNKKTAAQIVQTTSCDVEELESMLPFRGSNKIRAGKMKQMTLQLLCAAAAWIALTAFIMTGSATAEPREGGRNEYGVFRAVSPNRFVPIDQPIYMPAKQSALDDSERVIGLAVGDEARCYPLRLMAYHRIVNDVFGDLNVAVTYCVMADTAVTFLRESPDFKVCVGGLFGGVLVLRRAGGEDVWPQIAAAPVPDNPTSATLRLGPQPILTTFGAWRRAHPATRVLSPREGFEIYYEAYDKKPKGFNVNPMLNETVVLHDERLAPGEEVFGVSIDGASKAWRMADLKSAGKTEARVGSRSISIVWDERLGAPRLDNNFEGFAMRAYWYAWSQFYPETELHGISQANYRENNK